MRTIEKKIYPAYFEEIVQGRKTFELRLNDFVIDQGDTLILKEWDPTNKKYTGRQLKREVGYVGRWKIEDLDFWPQEDIKKKGLQIISLL